MTNDGIVHMKKATQKQIALRKRWVKALRSGKYKQGRGFLCHYERNAQEPSYCCLGVLMDLVAKRLGYCKETHPETPIVDFRRDHRTFASSALLEDVVVLIDLIDGFGFIERGARWPSLAAMNDDGASFDEIADMIENNPELIFRSV